MHRPSRLPPAPRAGTIRGPRPGRGPRTGAAAARCNRPSYCRAYMAHQTPAPLDLAAHTQAAIAATRVDDWGRAIAHLRVALAIAPQSAASWANLATALQRIGRLDDAERTA